MPTSPIPSHPSTAIIEETIDSIRDQLPTCEILVLIDGVKPEQAHRKADYDEYVASLIRLCRFQWSNVLPIVHDAYLHQGVMVRTVLPYIRTPLLLFVEHDTPLFGAPIEWEGCCAAIESDQARIVRFHHEASVLAVHMHQMIGVPMEVCGVRLWRTMQYSARPHLTSTEDYRQIIPRYFGWNSRTFLEDVLHGAVSSGWRAGWDQWRLWIYTPDVPDIKRSTHLDGRAGDPKWENKYRFDYDGADTPPGAPNARRDEA